MRIPTVEEAERRKRLDIRSETVGNAQSTDFPGHWPGEDHEWNLDYFRENFQVQFSDPEITTPYDSTFSLIGLDTSVANAFRRILLSEIPTLAIEHVFLHQNTSVIQDEVLAHRLGLIPLTGPRSGLKWLKHTPYKKPMGGEGGDESDRVPTDNDTISLSLKVKCEWKADGLQRAIQGETDPDKLYNHHSVYAKDLEWDPIGAQTEIFKEGPIRSTNPDILIVKMRPGQEINLQAHAVMGTGQDHAKFSPVATASYRLLPTIDIVKPIIGAEAKKFMRCFPRGVITLEKITAQEAKKDPEFKDKEGEVKAVVTNAMKDSVSRECLRHPEFKDKVKLGRVRDHFIFKVESTGQWESDELFVESVKLLKLKAQKIRAGLKEMSR